MPRFANGYCLQRNHRCVDSIHPRRGQAVALTSNPSTLSAGSLDRALAPPGYSRGCSGIGEDIPI